MNIRSRLHRRHSRIYAQSYAELRDQLAVVFQHLQAANLMLKPSKVRLFQREIKFLGHCVSGRGIAVDESKTTDILQWSISRNMHEIHQFLGLCTIGVTYKTMRGMPCHCMN